MMLSMKGRIMVGLGVFVGIICAFYFFVYIPEAEYRVSIDRQISQQNVRLIQLRRKKQELKELREKNKKILQDLLFLEEKLKETQASFLYELGERGRVYGIEYADITPLSSLEEEYYSRTPVKVHLYGKYHKLGMLLSDMAKRGGIGSFTVDNILLKTSSQEKYTIEAYLTFSLYKYKAISVSNSEDKESPSRVRVSEKMERRIR